jgi:hypothetical protein
MIEKNWILALLLMIFATPTKGWSQEDHPHPHDDTIPDMEVRIGKTGEVNLPTVRIDDIELKKGRYTIQHRVEGSAHWFTFVAKALKGRGSVKPVEVRARVIPNSERAKNSTILLVAPNYYYRLASIRLAGELVVYTF